MTAIATQELGSRAASGALWNYGSLTLTKAGALITSVVLAHTLTPGEFGVVSLALVIIGYLDILNNFGISSAVVYDSDDDPRAMSTAFWLSQGFGLTAFVLTAASAPFTSAFFDMPQLLPIQTVLGLSFLLASLGSVHDAKLRRSLQWRRRMPADAARSTAKTAGTITLALLGLGAWSIVWSQLAATLIFTLAVAVIVRWRPRFTWDWSAARRQMSFGGHYSASLALGTVAKDIDYVFIGAYLSSAALGWYTMGYRLPDLAIMGIAWAASQTAFPVFARMQASAVGDAVVTAQRLMALVTVPLTAILIVASPQLVDVLYGEAWTPVAVVMPFIAAGACLRALTFVGGDALKATGRVHVLTVVAAIRLPVTVGALLITVPHGILAVAQLQLALAIVSFAVDLVLIRRLTGPSIKAMLLACSGSVVGAAALVTAYLAIASLGWPVMVTLALGVTVGLALYAATVWHLEGEAIAAVRSSFGRRLAAGAA